MGGREEGRKEERGKSEREGGGRERERERERKRQGAKREQKQDVETPVVLKSSKSSQKTRIN